MLFNAVLCVWNEEDIIESTVKHLFAQGVQNVFVVDNDSTDETVRNAINAGAKLAATFKTKDFDETQKVVHLNSVVKYINEMTQEDTAWWLYADADEFPNIDGRETIGTYLKELDSSVRAMHGNLLAHLPAHPPYHVQGQHPIDFQPVCSKSKTEKHPLLRYDKGRPHLLSTGGAHNFITYGDPILVMRDILDIHHFQYRNPKHTFARTSILAKTRNEWYKRFLTQVNAPNPLAYEDRYNNLQSVYEKNNHLVALKTKKLIYNYKNIVRWYDAHAEKQFDGSDFEKHMCNAVYSFFMGDFDTALFRFNDALTLCDDDRLRVWLMVKIAECLSVTDADDAHKIIETIKKYDDAELANYIAGGFHHIESLHGDSHPDDLTREIVVYTTKFPDRAEKKYEELIQKIVGTLLHSSLSL